MYGAPELTPVANAVSGAGRHRGEALAAVDCCRTGLPKCFTTAMVRGPVEIADSITRSF